MDVGLNINSLQNNKNLGYNMSKSRIRNTKHLITLSKIARGDAITKVNQIIKLYSESKIKKQKLNSFFIPDKLIFFSSKRK